MFENVNGRRTDRRRTDDDGRRIHGYPISSPVSLRLRLAKKPVKSNKLEKIAQKEKLQSKHEKFQSNDFIENSSNISQKANIDFKSLIASGSSNKQTDFDTVFLYSCLVLLPTIIKC